MGRTDWASFELALLPLKIYQTLTLKSAKWIIINNLLLDTWFDLALFTGGIVLFSADPLPFSPIDTSDEPGLIRIP